jgi:hypothetical protein
MQKAEIKHCHHGGNSDWSHWTHVRRTEHDVSPGSSRERRQQQLLNQRTQMHAGEREPDHSKATFSKRHQRRSQATGADKRELRPGIAFLPSSGQTF